MLNVTEWVVSVTGWAATAWAVNGKVEIESVVMRCRIGTVCSWIQLIHLWYPPQAELQQAPAVVTAKLSFRTQTAMRAR